MSSRRTPLPTRVIDSTAEPVISQCALYRSFSASVKPSPHCACCCSYIQCEYAEKAAWRSFRLICCLLALTFPPFSRFPLSLAQVRIARIFNTFGPRMHPNDGRVVSNFIIQALREEPVTIYGDGSQTRSFQYVEDLVDGLIALMNRWVRCLDVHAFALARSCTQRAFPCCRA